MSSSLQHDRKKDLQQCSICQKFVSYGALLRHIEKVHPSEDLDKHRKQKKKAQKDRKAAKNSSPEAPPEKVITVLIKETLPKK